MELDYQIVYSDSEIAKLQFEIEKSGELERNQVQTLAQLTNKNKHFLQYVLPFIHMSCKFLES